MPLHAAEPFRRPVDGRPVDGGRVPPVLVPLPVASDPDGAETLLIDCDTCAVAGDACAECVVSVLLGRPADAPAGLEAGPEERSALRVLAEAGLVPTLRHVPAAGS